MRRHLLGILTAANFATASMGLPLLGEGGKFSASNIMPLVFAAVALVFYFARSDRIDRRIVSFFLWFNAASVLSFVVFILRFQWPPNFWVLLFQDVEMLFCLLLLWYARESHEDFRRWVRVGIYCSALVMTAYGIQDFRSGELTSAFGMDDKSHTAVLLCCEAFILIRFYGGKLDCLLALGLYVLSYATLSREPVFFGPAILFALLARSRQPLLAATAIASAGFAAAVYAGDVLVKTFVVFDRLSSLDAVTGEGSTSAHLLLIKSALQIKFSDPWAFFFGIGPGNFSQALTSFGTSIEQLRAVDPGLVNDALLGKAPVHSLPVSLLLDWNIAFAALFVFMVLRATAFLVNTRDFVGLMFLFGFLLAATFYSLHNKPYCFLIITTVIAFMQASRRVRNPVVCG
jgi:hypothetical protein